MKKKRKTRGGAKSYDELKKAGMCVKCRTRNADGSVCLYCRAMAKYFAECKASKKEFTRENFARTKAAQEAEKRLARDK